MRGGRTRCRNSRLHASAWASIWSGYRTCCVLTTTPEQVASIALLASIVKPTDHFTPIEMGDNVLVCIEESRSFLAKLDISGEIVHTPGHSEDSVTLLLDTG